MRIRIANQEPDLLPKKAVAIGSLKATWPIALGCAGVFIGFYFLLLSQYPGSPADFSLAYAVSSVIGWTLAVVSPTLWTYLVARRSMVSFRLLWELVNIHRQGPTARYWGVRGQHRARIIQNVETARLDEALEA